MKHLSVPFQCLHKRLPAVAGDIALAIAALAGKYLNIASTPERMLEALKP